MSLKEQERIQVERDIANLKLKSENCEQAMMNLFTENVELIHKNDDAEAAKSNLEKENAALKADMESLKCQLRTNTWLNDLLKRENEGLHVENKLKMVGMCEHL